MNSAFLVVVWVVRAGDAAIFVHHTGPVKAQFALGAFTKPAATQLQHARADNANKT